MKKIKHNKIFLTSALSFVSMLSITPTLISCSNNNSTNVNETFYQLQKEAKQIIDETISLFNSSTNLSTILSIDTTKKQTTNNVENVLLDLFKSFIITPNNCNFTAITLKDNSKINTFNQKVLNEQNGLWNDAVSIKEFFWIEMPNIDETNINLVKDINLKFVLSSGDYTKQSEIKLINLNQFNFITSNNFLDWKTAWENAFKVEKSQYIYSNALLKKYIESKNLTLDNITNAIQNPSQQNEQIINLLSFSFDNLNQEIFKLLDLSNQNNTNNDLKISAKYINYFLTNMPQKNIQVIFDFNSFLNDPTNKNISFIIYVNDKPLNRTDFETKKSQLIQAKINLTIK